ncbi:SIMPL domain-containing protein [Candidatus Saccharibacteria bacterium]|nr:SIMPL domain-containing protein [Candidatus Saccharibacteria bacterium]
MAENNSKLTLNLDFRIISLILAAVVIGMLAVWRPWAGATSNDRTVKVTGEAVVKTTPDEFVFYPMYELKNTDSQAGIAALSKKSDELVAKLKELGVEDKDIKTNSSNYDNKYYYPEKSDDGTTTFTLQLTVTVSDQEMAQKIQNYLITTDPSGTISPQPSFSTEKRKELESQARDEATKDARAKAEQSARNLGANLGKVQSVEDGAGFGGITPYDSVTLSDERSKTESSLSVQPGENEISYSVTVSYYLK